jgi:aryl-alcohol dehydrogenase-like predicted oxidoreductase
MRELPLGGKGPDVSVLGLGTMGLGGRYRRDLKDDAIQIRLLQTARDLGITYFDSAEVYAEGHAEELLGKAFKHTRDSVAISTKFEAGHSKYADVIAACEASLQRLNTDRIDIYQQHWPNPTVPLEETARALERLWSDGKIRTAGISNTTPHETRAMQTLLQGSVPISAMQQEYNLVERFVEAGLMDLCHELDITLTASSPIAQGRLAESGESNSDRLTTLGKLAADYGMTPAAMALAWVVRQKGVLALVMTSRLEHLHANVAAIEKEPEIADEDMAELSRCFTQPVIEVPTDRIDVIASHTGKVCRSVSDAIENRYGFSPTPSELSETLRVNGMLKPIKLHPSGSGNRYELFEGQLRYWAWVIAHDGKKPILATVHNG